METHQQWRTLRGQWFTQPIEDIVEDAIVRELAAGHKLKVCVGSDSQVYRSHVEYATVVAIVREGRGAFMFIQNQKEQFRPKIKERMLNEVAKSIEVAYAICDILDAYKVDLEVHVDINTNEQFQSNTALREAMGYLLGMGFAFKAKPYAFASSSCADKVV